MKKLDLKSLSGLMIRIALFAIVVSVTSCGSPDSKYEDACMLIGEMKFEEARDALANLGNEKLTVGNPKAAQAVCEAGLLMQKGETEDAWMKMKAVDESTSTWLVRVEKEDPLYQPAQNVALWIRASMIEKQFIEDMLEENPQSEEYAEHFKLKAPKLWPEEVLKEDLPSESDDDSYWEAPKIMQVSFKHVEILPEFKQVLGDYEKKYREYYNQLVEDEGEFRAWEEIYLAQQVEQDRMQNLPMDEWLLGSWYYESPVLQDVINVYQFSDGSFSKKQARSNGAVLDSKYYYYIVCEYSGNRLKIAHMDEPMDGRGYMCSVPSSIIRFVRIDADHMDMEGIPLTRM